MTKGVVYYTDNLLNPLLMSVVQEQILNSFDDEIISVSLKPIEFGWNVVLDQPRGILTMFKQILLGLETATADIIFMAEHDVLYHPSHFQFTPPSPSCYYYNQNVWKVDFISGHALHYPCSQTSGLVADRQLLINHYKKRVEMVEKNGFSRRMGFEPGTHARQERVDMIPSSTFMSEFPNIDIRHTSNLTPSRWAKAEFRNPKFTQGWTESDRVPGWGVTEGRFSEFLSHLTSGIAC